MVATWLATSVAVRVPGTIRQGTPCDRVGSSRRQGAAGPRAGRPGDVRRGGPRGRPARRRQVRGHDPRHVRRALPLVAGRDLFGSAGPGPRGGAGPAPPARGDRGRRRSWTGEAAAPP